MEFLIFLLIIASAVARNKSDKNKKSARQREQERRRKIQSAWEEAANGSDQSADPWGETRSSAPQQAKQADKGSYVPQDAAPADRPKPMERPSMEKKSAYVPVTTSGPAPTILERTKTAAVSAMKELQNTVKGSMDFDSAEGESSKEGKSRYKQKHVVRPFTEATHLHTESSITGTMPCPTEEDVYTAVPPQPAAAAPAGELLGSITGDELRRAVIYSEILGKPKGRR